MMRLLRGLMFSLIFYASTLVMAIVGLPLLALPRRWIFFWQGLWARMMMLELRVICGITSRIDGAIPKSQVIYAVKHQSAWETIVLLDLLNKPITVMKHSLLWIPLFGLYLWRYGVVGINRGRGAREIKRLMQASRTMANQGRGFLIFPQGTRLAPDAKEPYHSGVYALYASTGLAVVPIALNAGYFWQKISPAKNPGEIIVKILPPIPPGLSKRELMRRLEEVIEGESRKLAPTTSQKG